jgi:hypothetical protein
MDPTRHCRDYFGFPMIANGQELNTTVERIQRFHAQVARLRKVETSPMNYRLSASGFLAEIERIQLEAREYLSFHPAELTATASMAGVSAGTGGR